MENQIIVIELGIGETSQCANAMQMMMILKEAQELGKKIEAILDEADETAETVRIELTTYEWDSILAVLKMLPYMTVAETISKILTQATEQLNKGE